MEIVCLLPKRHGGTGLYRIRMPHEILDANVRFYMYDPEVPVTYEDLLGDILFVSKAMFLPVMEFLPRLRKAGVKLVLDYDDYWVLPQDHILYSNYKKFNTTKILIDSLREFDYITTTTDLLADEIRKINKNVVVLENAINPLLHQFENKPEKSDKIRFGWIGGHCHLPDIKLLEGASERLASVYDFRINLFGHDGREGSVYNEFARIMGGKTDKLTVYRSASADSYTRFYNLVDVSLIPLVDNKFNSMKSELKLVEAGFFKKAVICSDVMPYRKWLTDKNSLTCTNKTDWFKNMKRLVNNPEMIKDLGEQLYEDIYPTFNLWNVNKRRLEFYQSIVK